jgi:hypothetical protein
VPSSTPSLAPQIHVTAQDLNGLPDGTDVKLDVDLNNDNDYLDANEADHATGDLTDGFVLITLTALASTGTYKVRARVTDLAGNQATTASKTFTVTSSTSFSIADARIRTSDPVDGNSQAQLGNVAVVHALDMDRSPGHGAAGNPMLVYNSASVSQKPIVQTTIVTPNNAALPSTIGIEITWNGTSQGSPLFNEWLQCRRPYYHLSPSRQRRHDDGTLCLGRDRLHPRRLEPQHVGHDVRPRRGLQRVRRGMDLVDLELALRHSLGRQRPGRQALALWQRRLSLLPGN